MSEYVNKFSNQLFQPIIIQKELKIFFMKINSQMHGPEL